MFSFKATAVERNSRMRVAYTHLDGFGARVRRLFASDDRVKEIEVERKRAGLQPGEGD